MIDLAQLLLYGSILFRFLGIVVFVFWVIPVQYREAQKKDGIEVIRWGIFIGTLIFVGLGIIGLSTFLIDPDGIADILRVVRANVYFNFLSFVNAFGQFVISVILAAIYHQEYPNYRRDFK